METAMHTNGAKETARLKQPTKTVIDHATGPVMETAMHTNGAKETTN